MKLGSILQKGVVLWVSQSYKPGKHDALDFALPTITAKTPLCAPESGIPTPFFIIVSGTKRKTGYGLVGDSRAFYINNHCMLSVPEGIHVNRGQVIGYVDTLEHQKALGANLDGPHNHFMMYPHGYDKPPENYLYYADRSEVKYNRQPACTSTPLNYAGMPDLSLNDTNMKFALENRNNDLYLKDIVGTDSGNVYVYRTDFKNEIFSNFPRPATNCIIKGMDKKIYSVYYGGYMQVYDNRDIGQGDTEALKKTILELQAQVMSLNTDLANSKTTINSYEAIFNETKGAVKALKDRWV